MVLPFISTIPDITLNCESLADIVYYTCRTDLNLPITTFRSLQNALDRNALNRNNFKSMEASKSHLAHLIKYTNTMLLEDGIQKMPLR